MNERRSKPYITSINAQRNEQPVEKVPGTHNGRTSKNKFLLLVEDCGKKVPHPFFTLWSLNYIDYVTYTTITPLVPISPSTVLFTCLLIDNNNNNTTRKKKKKKKKNNNKKINCPYPNLIRGEKGATASGAVNLGHTG